MCESIFRFSLSHNIKNHHSFLLLSIIKRRPQQKFFIFSQEKIIYRILIDSQKHGFLKNKKKYLKMRVLQLLYGVVILTTAVLAKKGDDDGKGFYYPSEVRTLSLSLSLLKIFLTRNDNDSPQRRS